MIEQEWLKLARAVLKHAGFTEATIDPCDIEQVRCYRINFGVGIEFGQVDTQLGFTFDHGDDSHLNAEKLELAAKLVRILAPDCE